MKLPSDSPAVPSGHAITWFGHSTFVLRTAKGLRIMFDPWLKDNPTCPEALKKVPPLDLILVSHGHFDHAGDAVNAARSSGAAVVAIYELAESLERQGVKNVKPMNMGGTVEVNGVTATMVQAIHSSSADESGHRLYVGIAAGFVVRLEDGLTIYFAGDTALFGDMKVIRERYAPSVAFLPIGDRYTMGPEDAAIAAEWLGVRSVVPMHYATFPELTGTPEQLRTHLRSRNVTVLDLRPGDTRAIA